MKRSNQNEKLGDVSEETSPRSPSSARSEDTRRQAEVHSTPTPPWRRQEPLHSVLEGWQANLPKLYKYQPSQLQVVYHRESSDMSDTPSSSQRSSKTKAFSASSAVPKPKSKSGLHPDVYKRLAMGGSSTDSEVSDADKDVTIGSIDMDIDTTPPPSMAELVQQKSNALHLGGRQMTKADMAESSTQTILDTLDSESQTTCVSVQDVGQNTMLSSKEYGTQTEGLEIEELKKCMDCLSLKEELKELKGKLSMKTRECDTSNQIVDLLTSKNSALQSDKARLTELVRRLNGETAQLGQTAHGIYDLKQVLRESPLNGQLTGMQNAFDRGQLRDPLLTPFGKITPVKSGHGGLGHESSPSTLLKSSMSRMRDAMDEHSKVLMTMSTSRRNPYSSQPSSRLGMTTAVTRDRDLDRGPGTFSTSTPSGFEATSFIARNLFRTPAQGDWAEDDVDVDLEMDFASETPREAAIRERVLNETFTKDSTMS